MTDTKAFLCDTDFLIALYLETESTHSLAQSIFQKYNNFAIMNITFWEVATVLSRKLPHDNAIIVLNTIKKEFSNVYNFSDQDEQNAFDLYNSLTKKNISFFDCSCLVVAQKYDYKIASFDQFYPKSILAQ